MHKYREQPSVFQRDEEGAPIKQKELRGTNVQLQNKKKSQRCNTLGGKYSQ